MKKELDFIKNPNLVAVLLITKEKTQEDLIKSLKEVGFSVYEKPRFIYIRQ